MAIPKLFVLCGLPASGKSTYAQELAEKYNANIHSSDEIRKELSGDINNQHINDIVFSTLHKRVKDYLSNGKSCIYDSTNINYKRRMAFLQELNKIPCEKICILMATPYEECIKQNNTRDRKIPEEVIERMYKHFDVPYWYEGWDDIKVIYAENSLNYYGVPSDFIKSYRKYNQDNSHHKLTLGEHCEKAFLYMIEKLEYFNNDLLVSTLLHDCGKPFCKTIKQYSTQANYYNHQYTGSYDSLFWVTKYSNPLYVAILIRWHMQPYFLEKDNNEKLYNKYRKLWGEELYNDIILLHEADKYAH